MFNLSPVLPQANVSRSLYDTRTADDSATAFLKYNTHEHNPVVVPLFTAYSIKIGDPVYLYREDGTEVFVYTDPAVVDYVTATEIRVTKSSSEDLTNAVLYYRAKRESPNAKAIYGVRVAADEQTIRFSLTPSLYAANAQQSGAFSPAQAQALLRVVETVAVPVAADTTTYCVVPSLGYDAWLRSVVTYSSVASGSGILKSYFDEDPDQVFETLSTWESLVTDINVFAGLRFEQICVPEAEYLEVDYPTGRPVRPCSAGEMLFFAFDSAPSQSGLVYFSLHFEKVLN